MKTTIDLPDALLHEAKVVAAQRKTTLRELVVNGLQIALRPDAAARSPDAALARMKKGFRLGGRPLTREQAHARV